VTIGLAIFSMALFTIIDINGLKAGLYYRIREAQNAYDGSTYRYSVQGSSRSHFEDRIHEISMNEDVVKIYSKKPGTMYSGGFGQSDHRQKHVGLRSGRHQGEQAMVFTERLIRVVRQDGYGDFEADEHSRLTVCT
jgi:hypothetical protein